MYQKLNIPALGVVENMSYYECTNCHHEADIFGHGGGEQMAAADWRCRSSAGCRSTSRFASAAIVGIPLVIAEPESAGVAGVHRGRRADGAAGLDQGGAAEAEFKGRIPLVPVR